VGVLKLRMGIQMARKNELIGGILTKIALVALALSFPVGLFILNAPALKELIPKEVQNEIVVDLDKAIDAKSNEIAEIEMKILEARGELLKFEEMKISQLKELRVLYDRIASMLDVRETHLDLQNPSSK